MNRYVRGVLAGVMTFASLAGFARTISSAEDWQYVVTNETEWSASHTLGADLTVDASVFALPSFTGSLDGRGHTIRHVAGYAILSPHGGFVSQPGPSFVKVAKGATFSNLKIAFTPYASTLDRHNLVGSAAGCTFKGCTVVCGSLADSATDVNAMDCRLSCADGEGVLFGTVNGGRISGCAADGGVMVQAIGSSATVVKCTSNGHVLAGSSVATTFEECSVENSSFVAGAKTATFRKCRCVCSVSTCGGFVCSSDVITGCTFEKCQLDVTLNNSSAMWAGGYLGRGKECVFAGCTVKGAVSGKEHVGGFAGELEDSEFKESCLAYDLTVTAQEGHAGGIAGNLASSKASLSFVSNAQVSDGRNSSGGFVGGLFGYVSKSSEISECTVDKTNVTGFDNVGGLVGDIRDSKAEKLCALGGKVVGQNLVGGAFGNAKNCTIDKCASTMTVTGRVFAPDSNAANFGGFVGQLMDCTVSYCKATGDVTATEAAKYAGWCGGFAGTSNSSIAKSSAYGDVKGYSPVGGFVGMAMNLTVSDCLAQGSATSVGALGNSGIGMETVGAFVGDGAMLTTMARCYAIGKVTTSGAGAANPYMSMSFVGGLAADMTMGYMTTPAESSYWNTATTGTSESGLRGEGKTTAAMKKKATYVGWNFTGVWTMGTNGYPELQNVFSCTLPPPPQVDPVCNLSVNPESISVGCSGGKSAIAVKSSGTWSARKLSGDADCTLSALSGNGDAALTVSVSSNRTDAARSWSWQISSDCTTVTLEVRQEVCERPEPDCSCSIGVDIPQVVFDDCKSDSKRVGVTSSGPWSSKVTGGAGLLVTSAGSRGESTAVFTVSENTADKPREWDVTFTTRTDCGDTCSTMVHVTQGTCLHACRISVWPASRTVNANWHWGFVTVSANDSWTLDAKSVPRWVIPLLGAGTEGTWYVPYIVRAQPDCGDGTAVDPRRASLRFVNAQGCSDTFVLDQLGRDCCTFLGVFREGEEQYAFTTNCTAFSLPLEVRSSSAWTAVSESAWIRIAAEDHRTGLLTLGVSASPGGERMGTVRLTNVEGDERIFTVLQTPETLAIESSRIFLPAGAGETNIAISCSTNWTVSIPEDVRSWVSVSPDSGRRNGRIVLSVRPNADGDLRLAELTVAAGRIERELLVVQDTAATHLAITGPDSMRSDEVAENLCFVIRPGCKAEQVSPTWSVSGPDGIRIGSDGTVTLDGILLTQAVATVTARYEVDGRTLVGSREIEILPKPGPGVWTSDVAAALAGAKGDGRLIVALASDYNSCSRCRAFEPVARNPEFLKWAHDNGVYLIAATRSGPCGESVTDEYFWTLARSLGHTGSVPLPSLAFALPKAPYQGLGLDTARVGSSIGMVEYDGTVTTLIEGVASYLPTSDAIAFEDEFAYAEKGESFVLTVYGGSEETATSVKLNVAYVTAKASDFDLKSTTVEGAGGLEQKGIKFPLDLSWRKGDTEPKTITIPTKVGKAKDAPKYLTWTLSDAVGLGLGEPACCIGKIESGDDYAGDDVCVLPYVERGEGGKVSGGKAVKPDKKGRYASVTLKATPGKGYWFAGWYDEEGEFASGDLSFKVTPTSYGETTLLVYSARFIKADTSFCGTYNGTARVNLMGMTIVKDADTRESVFGDYPFTLTLSTAGKVSGSVKVGGKKVSFKGDACTLLEDGWAEFPVTLNEKSWFGKANSERFWVALNADGSVSGWAESLEGDRSPIADAEFPVSAHKAVGKDAASLSKVAKFAGTYSVWIPDDEGGLTTFALTIDVKGKVKAAGRMRDGSALAYSGSLGGYDEYFSPDGWANAYVYLDFALTAKSLGSGSCGVSLWLAKSLLDDDNAACPASVHVTKYMRGDVSALHSDDGTVIEYAPGCWACGSDSYVIETEDETITIPIVSKKDVVTGLGKPKEKGYTVKFDNKTGVLEIKKGKEYSIYGLLTSDGLFATRINADGSRSDVWTSACEAEDSDEVAEHYYGYVDDVSSDTGNPRWGLTRGTLTIDVLKSGTIRGTVVTGFGTKRYYADGFSDVDEDGRSAILMAMCGETLEFSIWNDRDWDEMQVEGWLQDSDFGKENKLQVSAQRDAFVLGPCGYAYDNLRCFSEVVGTWRLAAFPRDDYEVPDSAGMRYPYSHDFYLADSDTPGTLQLVVKANGMVEVSGSFDGEKVAGTWPVLVWWCDDESDSFNVPCHLKLANGKEVFMGFDLRSSRKSGEVMIMGEGWIRTFP